MPRHLTYVILIAFLLGCAATEPPIAELEVAPREIELGFPHYEALAIELAMLEPIDEIRPRMMIHLLDKSGSVVRTFDHELPGDWEAGASQKYSIELYQSALAPALAAGPYQLTAGLYGESGNRWPLGGEAEEIHGKEYAVARVTAREGSQSAPKFFFSPTWMATEAGTDVQILGRRWLRADGTVRVAGIRAPGTVRLLLRIAPPDPQLEDLILDEGYEDALLEVTTTCGDETFAFQGTGSHVLEVEVLPTAEDEAGDCEIELAPRYRVVTRRNLNTRTLALDLLAWRPTGSSD